MTEFLDCASLLELNNITPSVRKRRLSAELKLCINKFASIQLSFDNELDSFVLIIVDNNITPYFNTVSIILPTEYPFKPPKIKLNEHDYTSLLKMNSRDKLNAVKKFTGRDCLCCNTIICNDNWAPAITFIDIISEINRNIKLIDKISLQVSFDKIKLLLNDDYKNIETRKTLEKNI
jgi:ubiquitin-protein ligase